MTLEKINKPHAGCGRGEPSLFNQNPDLMRLLSEHYINCQPNCIRIMAHSIVIAFDLYGTLLSTESISKRLAEVTGSQDKGSQIATSWRKYQLEYTWRLSCMSTITHPYAFLEQPADCAGSYDNFSNVTRNALTHALSEASVRLEEGQIKQLMDEYDHLSTFPDVTAALRNQIGRAHV